MFGLSGAGVAAAYALSILAAGACVVYGLVNWNRPNDAEEQAEIAEEAAWEKKDEELEGKK